MEYKENILSQRLLQKALGLLNEQEAEDLDRLIAKDTKVQEEWNKVQSLVSDYGNLPSVKDSWDGLDERINTSRPHYNIRKAVVAAAIFLLGGISFLLLNYKPHKTIPAEISNILDKKQLLLHLANGKTINLANLKTMQLANGVKLNNNKNIRQLTYTEVDSSVSGINTLNVPAGMDYHLILSDGSEIMLNSATVIKFPFRFAKGKREITLDGEAFLNITHADKWPFIVHLPKGDVRVLGTTFNVNTYERKEKVSLLKGSVCFTTGVDSVRLIPGKAVVWNEKKHLVTNLDDNDLAWIDGKYILNNTSIGEISQLLPRWFDISVVVDNELVANKLFNGVIYKNKPLSGVLELLKGTTDVDYYYSKGVLHFK